MMENVVLRTNATPVYSFLSLINARHPLREGMPRGKILDCGAGGSLPPLALFARHGFEAWGIDVSETQLARARQFCEAQEIEVDLRRGDMRQIPFADETFDYVYEHYALCHLSKRDTALAIGEMRRVLRPQGLCFLGVISMDSWPKFLFGEERAPGEYWEDEDGVPSLHSMFSDDEAEALVGAWDVLAQEKRVKYLRDVANAMTLEAWVAFHRDAGSVGSVETWHESYAHRATAFQYAHMYVFLRKV